MIKPNIATEESEIKKNFIQIFKGCVFSIIFSLIFLTIYAMLLVYTEISESTIVPIVVIITGISILLGSTISTKNIKKNGIINGGIVGLSYIVILYLASSVCLVGFSFNLGFCGMLITRNINWNDRRHYGCKYK